MAFRSKTFLTTGLCLALCFGLAVTASARTVHLRTDFTGGEAVAGQLDGLVRDQSGLVLDALGAGAARGTFESGIISAPVDFTAVAPQWRAELPIGSHLTVEMRTSADGQEWGPYHPIRIDTHSIPREFYPDGRPNPNFGDTVGGMIHRSRGDGRFVSYRLTLDRDAEAMGSPTLSRFTLTFIDASQMPENLEPPRPVVGQQVGMYPKPPVTSRSEWGARPIAPGCSYSYASVTHIAIHHTAGVAEYSCSGATDCGTYVRGIQDLHMDTNGWCDIGYQYLSSNDGILFEGRGGGDDVIGAHDGHNSGSMAISQMGYYHDPYNHTWTNAQQDASAELAAWKADEKGIDVQGTSFYSGYGADMNNIYGHRQVSSTECPGDLVFDRLPEFRNLVDEKLGGGGCTFNMRLDDDELRGGDTMVFRMMLEHLKPETTTTELQMRILDADGNAFKWLSMGEHTFHYGEESRLSGSFQVPMGQAPGTYFLEAGLEDMLQGRVTRMVRFTIVE